MRRGWMMVAAAALAACGSTPPAPRPVAVDSYADVGIGMAELERDLESTVLENYSHLGLGNIEAYADSISQRAPIALFGPRPRDLVTSLAAFGQRRRHRMYAERDVRIFSKRLELHVASDGQSAWVADELSYRVPYAGREAALTLRYSGVFVREEGRWQLVAEHLSYPLPIDRIIALARAQRFPRLAALGDDTDEVAESAVGAVRALEAAAHEPGAEPLADELVWLPDPATEFRGAGASMAPALGSLFGQPLGIERAGALGRVIGSPSAQRAWLAEHLVVRARAFDDEVRVPVRALYVVEKKGETWRVVHAHLSVPMTDELLNERVFGKTTPTDRP